MGDGRTEASGFASKMLIRHSGATHVICPQYRLSTLPASATSNPFPAALQDSLTAYLYLINVLKISPRDIVLSGDSAGANLAISLLRYITEYGADLGIPSPSACLLWSPWINPSDASASYVYDNDHYTSDYISAPFTKMGLSCVSIRVQSPDQPYISHKNRPFETSVPLWINTGGTEVLYYDNVKWYEQNEASRQPYLPRRRRTCAS